MSALGCLSSSVVGLPPKSSCRLCVSQGFGEPWTRRIVIIGTLADGTGDASSDASHSFSKIDGGRQCLKDGRRSTGNLFAGCVYVLHCVAGLPSSDSFLVAVGYAELLDAESRDRHFHQGRLGTSGCSACLAPRNRSSSSWVQCCFVQQCCHAWPGRWY